MHIINYYIKYNKYKDRYGKHNKVWNVKLIN